MNFSLSKTIDVLERTPFVIHHLLREIDDDWSMNNEGAETFSPYDVVGHLIHGEKADWVTRMDIILSNAANKTFDRYDRFAQYRESAGKSLSQLIDEFSVLRKKNIEILKSKNLGEAELNMTGTHPSFGSVTLKQLLASWTVHDLGHIGQIVRVMAKQYKTAVGPWIEYQPILTRY